MLTNQQPVGRETIQQNPAVTQINTEASEKRKPQRKFSNIHQRVTEESSQILDSQKQQMRKSTFTKTKVHRRDTKQTDLAVSQISFLIQQPTEDSKMDELIKKSEEDPFLRRKLQTLMEKDIKSLKWWNSKNPVTENQPNNTSMVWATLGKKSFVPNTSQILDDEYKRIPKDISIVLNNSVLHKRNASVNDISVSKLPPKSRNTRCQIDENSVIIIGNQNTSKQQFTTLRKESYKGNVSRLEMMRQIEEKQKTLTGYVMERFSDKTNLQSISKLSKMSIPFER